MKAVLDASALLALLFREPGYEGVAGIINEACMSTVNVSEVLTRFARDGKDPDAVLAMLQRSTLQIVDFTLPQAAAAARLAPHVRAHGLSFADRVCLALAIEKGLPAWTADRVWQNLHLGADIRLIR
jgi:PIN domain nuclease of toxin-antitoxin system